jgi:hypothetical protein
MTYEPENPLAFPNHARGFYSTDGMSLRDWFAGQALGAMDLSGLGVLPDGPLAIAAGESAYAYADAMLAARTNLARNAGGTGE